MAQFEDLLFQGWSTAQDLADHLNVSLKTVYNWADRFPPTEVYNDRGLPRMLWSPEQRRDMTKWYLRRRRWDGRIKSNRKEG